MSQDPVDRSMRRMEMRRFLTRCEAQQGTIQRADNLHEVARLSTIAIPFPLTEDTEAMDARRTVKKYAEERARELFEGMLDHLVKAEPFAQAKLRKTLNEEILQFNGGLNALRTWAYARLAAVEQTLPGQHT